MRVLPQESGHSRRNDDAQCLCTVSAGLWAVRAAAASCVAAAIVSAARAFRGLPLGLQPAAIPCHHGCLPSGFASPLQPVWCHLLAMPDLSATGLRDLPSVLPPAVISCHHGFVASCCPAFVASCPAFSDACFGRLPQQLADSRCTGDVQGASTLPCRAMAACRTSICSVPGTFFHTRCLPLHRFVLHSTRQPAAVPCPSIALVLLWCLDALFRLAANPVGLATLVSPGCREHFVQGVAPSFPTPYLLRDSWSTLQPEAAPRLYSVLLVHWYLGALHKLACDAVGHDAPL